MKRHTVPVKLTEDQFSLARRRLFVEGLSWQRVLSALVNAYIMGDISVTLKGRYTLSPPSGYIPVVKISEGADEVEIEPDWGVNNPRPQMGATYDYTNEDIWKTRELVQYLRQTTGRNINILLLRKLLNHLKVPKVHTQWHFSGEDDPHVIRVVEAIDEGIYDEIARASIKKVSDHAARSKSKLDEQTKAKELTEKEKRIKHLRDLRKIEESDA